jgi:NAD(P)-dependent dehydrogenase (short-subunit alcohol dehydrogenase family)
MAMSPAMSNAHEQAPSMRERVRRRSSLGRIGEAEADVGPSAVFLASDASGYVTGQTIVANSGSLLL